MRDYRRIEAWKRAHALAIALHKLARGFTHAGHARLRAQLTNAADSIADNIVRGCGASTSKEFARYLDMSLTSGNETENHLLSSRDLVLVSPEDWQKYTAETIAIRKMIYVYRKRLLSGD
jgi:four helix bundle protein